jgi:endonuclease/exonuclease/phosphatase family metal-dependent hydrolase
MGPKNIKALATCFFVVSSILLVLYPNTAHATNIYVTKSGSPAPTGEQSAPFHVIEAAVVRAESEPGSRILIGPGKYYEDFTIETACVLHAMQGTAIIGKRDYGEATTLQLITLNTHLAGDEVFFPDKWADYQRADDIADFIKLMSEKPDVVGFQEIWDADLFKGGDGADGIRPRAGYPYGKHGERHGDILNSGAALMSKYPLAGFKQVEFQEDGGFFDPEKHAAKGWVRATIEKHGFSIGVFNTHTHAESNVVRSAQIYQLINAVNKYRVANPTHVVFMIGDFNVYGETHEYNDSLIPYIDLAGGKDAARNSPGFKFDNSQWTHSETNPLATYFNPDAEGGRLDYIFYISSLNEAVEVVPKVADVLPFRGRNHCCIEVPFPPFKICRVDMEQICVTNPLTSDEICLNAFCTTESSDHWAVYGQFKLIRK